MKPFTNITKTEYNSQMVRFYEIMKRRREERVIDLTNDILEEFRNGDKDTTLVFKLSSGHIVDAYAIMDAVTYLLLKRGIHSTFTIKVAERTEGDDDVEEAGQSSCKYQMELEVFAFKATE
jgi:hypothetical protein